MKKALALILAITLILSSAFSASAAQGNVTYSGDSGKFIFAPGSEFSPTDLFPSFKDVMPGDVLTQQITVKNEASSRVKVKIFMRSLGAHTDSADFLSKLGLTVEKSADNAMEYMFDATADETAQLTDWVLLGTLYSGGEVNLDVTLHMPTEVDNTYKDLVGYLDWEFMVEEYPVEDSDPKPPKTGAMTNLVPWIITFTASAAVLFIIVLWRRKREKENQNAQ